MTEPVKTGVNKPLEELADTMLKGIEGADLESLRMRIDQHALGDRSMPIPGGEAMVTLTIPVERAITPGDAVESFMQTVFRGGLLDLIYIVTATETGETFLLDGYGREIDPRELEPDTPPVAPPADEA